MNFSINFFGYDITSLVTFFVGAIVTAIISYIFSYRREIQFLKYRIQIDTAEELLKIAKEYFDCSAKSKLYSDFVIKQYNLAFNVNTKKSNVSLSLIDIYTKRISETFSEWDISFNSYTKSFLEITYYLELRRIVLNKVYKCHDELLDQFRNINVKRNEIKPIQFQILLASGSYNYIDDKTSDDFNTLLSEYRELLYDLDGLIYDLQIGIQNIYYRKIFFAKIPKRKPIDSNLKTLKI
jgi:hypothetical protein